jgi:hypothetical protein
LSSTEIDEIGYLPIGSGGGNLFFPAGERVLRALRHDPDVHPRLICAAPPGAVRLCPSSAHGGTPVYRRSVKRC